MVSMEDQASQAPKKQSGVVKQVTSGDTVVIRGQPRGGPPPEILLCFSNVFAPKLARKGQAEESDDEPYAWEAREFLRKKTIGKEVQFTIDNEIPGSTRRYGRIWLVQDGNATENIVESMVTEGLVQVKKVAGARDMDQLKALQTLEEQAKGSRRGQWEGVSDRHIRDINVPSTPDDLIRFYHNNKSAPIKAIVEYVKDCCTLKITILPGFQPVFLQMTGIRAGPPSTRENPKENPYDGESRFFVESRLLNRDVEVILEDQPQNMALVGTIVHPAGSIAEALVKQGFARCMDQSIQKYSSGLDKLRAAEREAKANKLRIWKEYESPLSNVREDERRFTGKVIEINSADSITIKTTTGQHKKIFISGIRPPKSGNNEGDASNRSAPAGKFKPLYDIPYMYEAREFLRRKLLGQKVEITLDYKQEARQNENQSNLPERLCCTVMLGDMNAAEALLSRGLVSVVYYKVGDEQRPAAYDNLLMAGNKAKEERKGMHAANTVTPMRVSEVADAIKAKAFLSEFKRAGKMDGVVEYVGSGSRFRVYLPKNSVVVSVILSGVFCPKASRMGPNNQIIPAEEGGEAAMNFAKETCAQRDVKVEIDNIDKVGNFIGWLSVDGKNVSLELVQAGHASVHDYSAEKSPYYSALKAAEKTARDSKLNIWKNYDEQTDTQTTMPQQEDTAERRENFEKVMVVETLPGLKFYAQNVKDGQKLEVLMEDLRQALRSDPPLPGSFTPRKNELCAARFSADGQWYRAKVESLQRNNKASVLYIDYGNRELTDTTDLATLPENFKRTEPMAKLYILAFVREHNPEESDVDEVFKHVLPPHALNLNVEYEFEHVKYVTLSDPETKDDIGKTLVSEGHVLVAPRGGRSRKIVDEYLEAQNEAKKRRKNIWQYGDVTEDDAKEFGHLRR